MQSSSFFEILKNPNDNGIVIFVLGILFILSVYHFLLYFQHKDKVYLHYSLYTFLIFISHLRFPNLGFISILTEPLNGVINDSHLVIMWLYNAQYFIFGFGFINLKKYIPKWYSIMYKITYSIIFYIFLIGIIAFVTSNINIIYKNNLYIVIFFFLFGIVSYYPLLNNKNPLRYYIIFGSLVLFITSLFGFYIVNVGPSKGIGFSVFYIGVIVENIIFTLGLGAKQKMIIQEKNESQQKLIDQLKENQQLKETIQKQLESDVIALSKQAEEAKLEKIKTKYDKELAELKISSLRNQMNPHFIFNSLNAIKLYIIENKKQDAVYYLNKFSKLIRKILATTREKEITLADEIDTLKLYMDIENIRFNNEIETTFTIDEKLNSNTIKIPSLILQPFIENAIWHGLSLKKENKKIAVSFEKENKSHVKITISDNGIGRKKAAEIRNKKIHKKESIGIKLTEERLNHFSKNFTNNYTIHFIDLYDSENKSIGTTVVLKVPLV